MLMQQALCWFISSTSRQDADSCQLCVPLVCRASGRWPPGRAVTSARAAQVIVEPHRHEGIFIARGKEDALVTKNLVPGESVYGEKRVSVEVRRLPRPAPAGPWPQRRRLRRRRRCSDAAPTWSLQAGHSCALSSRSQDLVSSARQL